MFPTKKWVTFADAERARKLYSKLGLLENPKLKSFKPGALTILVEVDGKMRFVELAEDDPSGAEEMNREIFSLAQSLFDYEWKAYQQALKDPTFKRDLIDPVNDPLLEVLKKICRKFSLNIEAELMSPQRTIKKTSARKQAPKFFLFNFICPNL